MSADKETVKAMTAVMTYDATRPENAKAILAAIKRGDVPGVRYDLLGSEAAE